MQNFESGVTLICVRSQMPALDLDNNFQGFDKKSGLQERCFPESRNPFFRGCTPAGKFVLIAFSLKNFQNGRHYWKKFKPYNWKVGQLVHKLSLVSCLEDGRFWLGW